MMRLLIFRKRVVVTMTILTNDNYPKQVFQLLIL